MANKEKAEFEVYVRKKLRNGYPAGELRNELLAEGYSSEEIEAAFYKSIGKQNKTANTNPGQYPLWFFLSVGLLITGVAFKSIQGSLFNGHWTDWILLAGILGTALGLFFVYLKKD